MAFGDFRLSFIGRSVRLTILGKGFLLVALPLLFQLGFIGLMTETGSFRSETERFADERSDLRAPNHRDFRVVILVGTGMSVLLGVLSAFVFARGISRRLAAVTANIQNLAQGHELAPPVGGSDEIATVDRAFREVAQTLAQSREDLAKHALILQSMLDNMGDGVIVADEAGKFLVFNRAAERIVGLGPIEGEPREWSERYGIFYPDQTTLYPSEQLPLARAMRGEEVDAAELFVRNPALSEGIWVTVNARPLRDAEGPARGGVVVFQDITRRKLAENDLRLSEQNLAITLDSIGDAVIATDAQRRITRMNPIAEQLTGWTRDEALGRPIGEVFQIINEQTWQPAVIPVDDVLATGEIHGLANHTALKARNGSVCSISDSAAPIRDNAGRIVGVVLTFRDITVERLAEDKFRRVVEAAPSAMLLVDPSGCITLVNTRAEELFGYSRTELLGQPIERLVPEQAHSRHPEYVRDFFASPQSRAMGAGRDLFAVGKNGAEIPVEIGLSLLNTADGPCALASVIDISERKRAEAALRRSEQKLAITLDSIGDAVMATDAERRITRMNPVAEKLTGWTQAEARGRPIDEVFHIINEETRRAAVIPVDDVLATGIIHGLANHTVLIARDGTERPIADSAAPIRDDAGKIIGVVLVFRDVVEERRFEQELHQLNADLARRVAERTAELSDSEKRFRLLVEHAADGIFIVDSQGFYRDVNSSGCELLGYTREEVLRMNVRDIVVPEEQIRVAPELAEFAIEGQPYLREWSMHRKDGEKLVVEVNARTLPDGRILALVRDISERKRAEKREQNQSRVFQSLASGGSLEQTLEVIAQAVEAEVPNTLCSILLLDESGKCLLQGAAPSLPSFYNKAIHGICIGEGVGSCGTAAFNRQRVIVEDILTHPYWDNYRELATKAGLRSCWSEPILSVAGHVLGTFAIYHREPRVPQAEDLSRIEWAARFVRIAIERKQMESLARDKAAAEAASQAKSEFLASMSHELRAPLNGILGMNELLLNTELTERQRQFVDASVTSGKALMQQVNDILDLSKIEAGKLELDLHQCHLEALVFDVADVFMYAAQKKGYPFHCHFDPAACVKVVCDGNRIRQILVNLLGNALKFTTAGGVSLRAECTSWIDDQLVMRFSVTDTGVGIPADRVDCLFAPFSQVDQSTARHFGGTGLGLSICKQLVDLMGGTIGVESQLGVGSTFWFELTLPLIGDDTAVSTRRNIVVGQRVLAVDEDGSDQRQIVDCLKTWGCRTQQVGNVRDVVEVVTRGKTDGAPIAVVLADFRLMVGDELVLLQKLANDSRLSIIGFGQNPDDETIASLRQFGVRHVLRDPIRPSTLFNALTSVLAVKSPTKSPDPKPDAVADKQPSSFTGHILVAEDNSINQMFVRELLKHCGCTCDIANNGDEALTAVQRNRYDLVLMDCQMPEMDGFTASREIRRREAAGELTGRLPIIALTANALKGDRDRCLEAGMDEYLSKPLQAAQLQTMLAKHLAVRSAKPTAPRDEAAK